MAEPAETIQPPAEPAMVGPQRTDQSESDDHAGVLTPETIRHNMKVMIFLEAIYATGFADLQMTLQPLLDYLGASYKVAGFVTGITWPALLGCFLTPYITRRFPYKKWLYVSISVAYSLLILLLGVGLVLTPHWHPSARTALIFTVVCFFFYYVIFGFTALPHMEDLANCLPVNYRGRMFGISLTIGSLGSVGIISLSMVLLKVFAEPVNYGYCFLLTSVLWIAGFGFSALAREVPTPVDKSPKPWTGGMLLAFWQDKAYVRFLSVWTLAHLTFVPINGMIPFYGFHELKMAAYTAAIIGNIGQIARILGMTPSGFLIDKHTPARVLPYTMLAIGGGYLICSAMNNPWGVYISQGVLALAFCVFYACGTVLAVSLPRPEHRAGHLAIQNIITMIFFAVGPMIAGWISDLIPFRHVCLGAGVVAMLFFPFSARVFRSFGKEMH